LPNKGYQFTFNIGKEVLFYVIYEKTRTTR